ncbi:anthrone oxygenase family protein (plasmid) [Streptomyces sp. WC2508]|uniref:anthrone oxygenase family protein n=1 Tax=Streptomyces sp. WC2508 TaxID=3461405 RepID=UPI00404482AE
MKNVQTGVLIAATLSTGLMAGLFAAFAYAVMPGLAKSSDHTLVEAMQSINKAILNPVFMLPFMGAIPLLGLAVVLAWRGHGRSALPWLIAALVLYLVAFMVTSGVNVPLNDQLARAGDPAHAGQLAATRADFENKWVLWNVVRALLHTAAFACLAWALFVYGAHQPHESGQTGASARIPAPAFRSGHPPVAQHPQEARPHYAPLVSPAPGPDDGARA